MATRAKAAVRSISERARAAAAGIGWQGKHTNLLSRELGNWFFLGAIFTTLDLHRRLVDNDDVLAGDYNIHWLEKFLADTKAEAEKG